MKNPSIFFAKSIYMLLPANGFRLASRTCCHTIWYRLFGFGNLVGSFFVLFHLQYVNSIGASCTEAIQPTLVQRLYQGGTFEKIIKKHVPMDIFQDLAYSNLNSIPFSPFALGTILIDRRNLFHCHIYTNLWNPS